MTVTSPADLFKGLGLDVADGPGLAGFEVDGLRPSAAVRPRDADEVSAALRLAATHGLRVIPHGGGVYLGLGNTPSGYDVALDLSAMNQVIEYRPRDLTVTAQAGMTAAALQRELDTGHQLLALDPPMPERATIGGVVAANVSGPRRFRYGTARDIVIGASVVLADGTGVKSGGRVVKNVAGYDLNKLLTGSMGTLAVITSLTFKLMPAPPERAMVTGGFATLEAAHRATMGIANSTLSPLTLDIAGPSVAAGLAVGAGTAEGAGWLLISELAGTAAAVDRTRAELFAALAEAGCDGAHAHADRVRERLTAAVRDFGYAETGRALLLRLSVLPSQAPAACHSLLEAASTAGVGADLVVRAGNGSVLAALALAEAGTVRSLVAWVREALRPLGGTMVVERCPAAAKQALEVWGIDGPDVGLMRRVKQSFDPVGVLSPGRGPGRL